MIIRNTQEILSHGNISGRKVVLDVLEAGLQASDPYDEVKKLVRIQDGKLLIGSAEETEYRQHPPMSFDLSKVGHIYAIGGGKAAQRQAEALEDILGDLIVDGHVNAKKGDTIRLKRIGVTLAGHPIPDEDSVAGARKIVEVAQKARKGDIVFFSESGGGSALLTLPAPGITLQDLQDLNRLLYFEAGAGMPETNAVRNLLTVLRQKEIRYTGGADFIQISTEERPPNLRVYVNSKASPTVSSDEAYQNAIEILKRYNCWDKVAESIRQFLLQADPQYAHLTPEERAGVHRFRIIGPERMLDAASAQAHQLGLNATIIASSISGVEASCVGEVMAYMAQEAEVYGRPLPPPCVFLCGGELVVTVGDGTGDGGRNQEFALSTALRLAGSDRIVIASVDSDGNDGPTDQAGGIVDGLTLTRAKEAGIDVAEELLAHNSSGALRKLGDTFFTGVRGTNVQDLRVVYVGE